jgi:hypothetical protein
VPTNRISQWHAKITLIGVWMNSQVVTILESVVLILETLDSQLISVANAIQNARVNALTRIFKTPPKTQP